MSGVCASCDEPTEDDESLCATCLASPDELEAQATVARTLGARVEIAQLYRAARGAARLARIYMNEAQTVDARARACLNELAGCRSQIQSLRHGDVAIPVSERPGLKKAQPAAQPQEGAKPGRSRASAS